MASTLIDIRPLPGYVLVDIFDRGGNVLKFGDKNFYTLQDAVFEGYQQYDQRHPGIRPRWAHVLAASDQAEEDGLRLGDTVLCDTMKWSRGLNFQRNGFGSFMKFWRMDFRDILVVDVEDRDRRCLNLIADYKTKLVMARRQWGQK